jgi:hypothetical protein
MIIRNSYRTSYRNRRSSKSETVAETEKVPNIKTVSETETKIISQTEK